MGIDRVRAYDLRHTFGTEMYRRTGDPLVVQHLMCHRQASTTARYIRAAVPEMVARAIRSIDAADSHGSPAWQSGAEPPLTAPNVLNLMERETGFEPATSSLGS